MSETSIRTHEESVTVQSSAEDLYDLVSDITRTGEWSPVCRSCWWDDEAEAGQVGAWFTGRNELPHRTWDTRSQVVAAERGREFAWVVGGRFVRWGFTLAPTETGTVLTESWAFLPGGIAMFEERFGDDAPLQHELQRVQSYRHHASHDSGQSPHEPGGNSRPAHFPPRHRPRHRILGRQRVMTCSPTPRRPSVRSDHLPVDAGRCHPEPVDATPTQPLPRPSISS